MQPRALYSWVARQGTRLGQGIFHSGARFGAAFSLVAMPILIDAIGWRMTFVANGGVGFVWAAIWWIWFRNDLHSHAGTNASERELIRAGIEDEETADNSHISYFPDCDFEECASGDVAVRRPVISPSLSALLGSIPI